MKVVLLKPSPLMQEKAKEEEEVKVAETQRRLHWWPEQRQGRRGTQNMEAKRGLYPKLILRAETKVSESPER